MLNIKLFQAIITEIRFIKVNGLHEKAIFKMEKKNRKNNFAKTGACIKQHIKNHQYRKLEYADMKILLYITLLSLETDVPTLLCLGRSMYLMEGAHFLVVYCIFLLTHAINTLILDKLSLLIIGNSETYMLQLLQGRYFHYNRDGNMKLTGWCKYM